MICKKCGSQLDNDSNFCPICGSSIVSEHEKTETKIQTTDTKASSQSIVSKTYDSTKTNIAERNKNDKESELYGSKAPKVNSGSKKIVALLLILIAVICVYFVINNSGDSSDKKSGRGGSGSYTQNSTTSATTTEQHTSATTTEHQTTVSTTEHHTSTSTTTVTTTEHHTSATTTEQQTTATTEQQASAGTTTQTETELSTTASTEELANEADFNSYEAIAKLIGLQAECELKAEACRCGEGNRGKRYSNNPYDVDYNYGDLYQSYVDACDWSLVFDADYYMEQFPYLALQYNYDRDWLLYHFQTIGIHEGRQGCADFNVRVYLDSTCDYDDHIYETFDKNWECYYFYYMLNYDSQESLETKSKDGIEAKFQYKTILTYNQAKELDQLNALRAENNLPALQINSELNAFANYRARIDFEEGNVAHAWAEKNTNYCLNMAKTVANTYDLNVITVIYAENKTMHNIGDTTTGYTNLLDSPDHVKQMLYDNISYTGLSNNFNGFNDFDTRGGYNKIVTINFEIFI